MRRSSGGSFLGGKAEGAWSYAFMSWTGTFLPLPLCDVGNLYNKRYVTAINHRQCQWESHAYPTCRQMCILFYSRIKFAKSPSFSVTTFRANITNLTGFLTQSRDWSCYVSWRILVSPAQRLQKHTDLRALDFAYICGQHWPTLPAPEAGDFVICTLLYIVVPLIWLQCHTIIVRSRQKILFRVPPVSNGSDFLTTSPTR